MIESTASHLQKEKKDKIQEAWHKLLEVELQLENVEVKHDGIISKAKATNDQLE